MMTKQTKMIMALLGVAVVTALGGTARADKWYAVDGIDVAARVNEAGVLSITEDISYRFNGRYRYAYRDLPLRGVSITSIGVSEAGQPYVEDASEEPGTFAIQRSADQLRVTWYYRARNESRTFRLTYQVEGAVARHGDTAELYYQFVGDGWSQAIGRVDVAVSLPSWVAPGQIKAWAHGPLYGRIRITGESRVDLTVSPLPAHTYFEGRILFPPEFVPELKPSVHGERLQAIIAQENAWAREADDRREQQRRRVEALRAEAERRRALARKLWPVSIALVLLSITVWWMLFRQYGAPHQVTSRVAPGDVPSDHPPALVAFLIGRAVGGPALVATLLDLADRGYFTIHEMATEGRGWFGSKQQVDYRFERTKTPLGDLAGFEREVVDFMMEVAGDGNGFTMSALKKAARRRRQEFRRWFTGWMKQVKRAAASEDFYEPWVGKVLAANIATGVLVAGAGALISMVTESPAGLPAIVAGVLQAVMSVTLGRRTEGGQRLYLAYKGFRRHLKTISRAAGPTRLSSNEWGRYLALGIIFGLHKKLLPRIELSDAGGAHAFPVWYMAAVAHGSGADAASTLAAGLSSMVTSVSSTVSSSTGAGGGASGGGGGGAGGGGGGAG